MNTHDGTPVSAPADAPEQSTNHNQPIARRSFLALAPLLAAGASHGALASEPRLDMGNFKESDEEVEPKISHDDDEHDEAATESYSRGPWLYCLEVATGLELYYVTYQREEETVPGLLVLSDEDGRLLYCMDTDKIPGLLRLGHTSLRKLGAPDSEEFTYASVPDALSELRSGERLGQCWELFYVFDALTDLLASCGHTYDDGIFNFLMGCFSHMLGTQEDSLKGAIEERGYQELSVEEGIQLALGIVLARGRLVA